MLAVCKPGELSAVYDEDDTLYLRYSNDTISEETYDYVIALVRVPKELTSVMSRE